MQSVNSLATIASSGLDVASTSTRCSASSTGTPYFARQPQVIDGIRQDGPKADLAGAFRDPLHREPRAKDDWEPRAYVKHAFRQHIAGHFRHGVVDDSNVPRQGSRTKHVERIGRMNSRFRKVTQCFESRSSGFCDIDVIIDNQNAS